jgi:SAM-dependent methyltransferase
MENKMNETLNYYADHAQEFLTSTLGADMSATYARVLPLIPAGAAILDLGCGSGRDSLAFKKLGYQVTAADGSRELAQAAQQLLGQAVLCAEYKALELPPQHFDLIWACASLVHVPLKELPAAPDEVKGEPETGRLMVYVV